MTCKNALLSAVIVVGMIVADSVFAVQTWTEYFGGTPPTSGKITIDSGAEIVINDDEMAASSACTITLPADATLFFNTTSFPQFSFGTGSRGKVVKTSSCNWESSSSKKQANFKGAYEIAAGNVSFQSLTPFGDPAVLDTGTLYATNGAAITINGKSMYLGTVPLHLAGSIVFTTSAYTYSPFRFLTLYGDSSIESTTASATIDAFDADHPSFIDLNGHAFSFNGGAVVTLKNGSFRGAGSVAIAAGTSSKPHFLYLDNFGFESDGVPGDVVEMNAYTGIGAKTPLTIGRKVRLTASSVRFPGPCWTTFAGGLEGAGEVVPEFVKNSVGDGMVSFPGRTIAFLPEEYPVWTDTDVDALWVGHCATGGLWVAEGMTVSNKLLVGGTSDPKKYQIGCGTVRQTGGEVCIVGVSDTSKVRYASVLGFSAHSYYEITGGVTRVLGSFASGMASPSIIAQFGGTFIHSALPGVESRPSAFMPLQVNDKDGVGIPSVIYIAGGKMVLGQVLLSHGRASEAEVTVTGAGSELESEARIYAAYSSNTVSVVNMNDGGTVSTPYFAFARDTVGSVFYVNFDGGIMRVMPSVYGESMLTTLFGTPGGNVPTVTRVTVGPRGAAIDTNGRTMSSEVPLASPYGKVVESIPFAAEETGWTVAPHVKIVDATGAGATAVADFDSATCTLRGFRVTSGGWNYSCPTAQVVVCKRVVKEIPCTISDASTAGSFTKKGAGTLIFSVANSYGGATVVEGGALRLGTAGALPAGSEVILRGGSIETVSGVDFPASLTIDSSVLVPGSEYVLSEKYRDSTLPEIVGASGWKARIKDGRLVLSEERGLMLILR